MSGSGGLQDAGFLVAVLESLPFAVTFSDAVRDHDGRAIDMRLTWMNARARDGQPDPAAAIGGLCSELWPQMVANGSFAACMRVLDSGVSETGEFGWTEEETYRPAPYEYTASRVGDDALVWVLRDSTDTVRRLAEREARFRAAFDGAPVGMALLDLDGSLRDANTALVELLGRDPTELGELGLAGVAHPADLASVQELVAELEVPTHRQLGRARLVRHDGTTAWASMSLSVVGDAHAAEAVAHVVDVSEQVQLLERLQVLAATDSLTGLANRRTFQEHLDDTLAEPGGDCWGVALVDLDRFKYVNDALGHAVGDELLTQIGGRLASGLSHGGGEMVGRFGGDEFLALIRDRDPAAVERRVSALLADLARPATVGTARVVVGASAGLVIAGSGSTGGDAIRDADIALYRAKERQRGSLEVFRGDLRDRAVAASEIEQDLQRALADGRIHLVYQPQRSLADDRHAQVEALLRVDTPTGAVGAAPFIRIAEETALIIPIGRDVLGQAVAAARTAATLGDDVVVWVNLSVRQLFDVGLLDDVGAALDVAEIAPHQIGFEITESILIDDAAVPPVLDRLSARGHRLAIDDFGAGYSSLGYLHRLPFDVLKLDRGIVAGCDRDGPNAEIVAAVTALAHRLGLDVVAEGVETAAELEAVARLGCDHAQGFAVARPGDIDSWLTLAR